MSGTLLKITLAPSIHPQFRERTYRHFCFKRRHQATFASATPSDRSFKRGKQRTKIKYDSLNSPVPLPQPSSDTTPVAIDPVTGKIPTSAAIDGQSIPAKEEATRARGWIRATKSTLPDNTVGQQQRPLGSNNSSSKNTTSLGRSSSAQNPLSTPSARKTVRRGLKLDVTSVTGDATDAQSASKQAWHPPWHARRRGGPRPWRSTTPPPTLPPPDRTPGLGRSKQTMHKASQSGKALDANTAIREGRLDEYITMLLELPEGRLDGGDSMSDWPPVKWYSVYKIREQGLYMGEAGHPPPTTPLPDILQVLREYDVPTTAKFVREVKELVRHWLVKPEKQGLREWLSGLVQLEQTYGFSIRPQLPWFKHLLCRPVEHLEASFLQLQHLLGISRLRAARMVSKNPHLLFKTEAQLWLDMEELVDVFCMRRQRVVDMAIAQVGLLGYDPLLVRTKWQRICNVVSQYAPWQEELEGLPPPRLAAVVTASHVVLDRLEYIELRKRCGEISLYEVVTYPHRKWQLDFPDFHQFKLDNPMLGGHYSRSLTSKNAMGWTWHHLMQCYGEGHTMFLELLERRGLILAEREARQVADADRAEDPHVQQGTSQPGPAGAASTGYATGGASTRGMIPVMQQAAASKEQGKTVGGGSGKQPRSTPRPPTDKDSHGDGLSKDVQGSKGGYRSKGSFRYIKLKMGK